MNNIKAEVIAKSTCATGLDITTFRLTYPRFIHSELLTSRLFSRNSASSRAVPLKQNIEYILANPAKPIHWGLNQPGMSAHQELDSLSQERAEAVWMSALSNAVVHAEALGELGVHKQVANRLLEPFVMMNTIITAVDFNNFYYLRRKVPGYDEAQPELADLAEKMMYEASESITPEFLQTSEWHLPFINKNIGKFKYSIEGTKLTLDEALKVSASICAQVSYRKEDLSLQKAEKIWEKLITSSRLHASPAEHQATPIILSPEEDWRAVKGISHIDRDGHCWSGNFRGWIQHRKLLANEAVW